MVEKYSRTVQSLDRPAIIGESVLIDKETGRVLWEGGGSGGGDDDAAISTTRSSFAASLEPRLDRLGVEHVKAVLLSGILVVGLLGALSKFLKIRMLLVVGDGSSSRSAAAGKSSSMYRAGITLLLQCTLFRFPQFRCWFLALVIALYLIEAYTCR